jgi:dTDP-4-dehydrorhamnose reductase
MAESKASEEQVFMVFGGLSGWIGQQVCDLLEKAGKSVHRATSRLENRDDCARELDEVKPFAVINCAGVTGRPNVDWCEDHKAEVLRTNVIGTMSLLDLCEQRKLHITNFATGCIYSYDEEHPIGGKMFKEEDEANFHGSFYSHTKALVEDMCRAYEQCLILRLRMPISDDLHHRSFVTKITKYAKVVNIPNSMSILTELLPVAITMTERKIKGIYNFTNPGPISHGEILQLYKEKIDPTFTWTLFSEEEQNKILKAGRSNNTLDTSKLEAAVPDVRITPVKEAIVGVFDRMRDNLLKAGGLPCKNPEAAAAAGGPAAVASQ